MTGFERSADEPDRLVEFVQALSPLELTPGEIAEAVWLATATSGFGAGGLEAADCDDDGRPGHADPDPGESRQRDSARRRFPVYRGPDGSDGKPTAVCAPAEPRRESPEPAGSPIAIGPPSGANADRLGRALRGLRSRPVPGPLSAGIDEAATAQAAALSGVCWPVPKALRPRRAEAILLVDGSVSMGLWTELQSDVLGALVVCGAFRKVTSWSLSLRSGQVRIWPHGLSSGPDQPLHRLCDPTGRSVVLILTDGASALWHSGAGAAAAAELAEYCPVAVIEPLPHRLWRRTGLRVHTTVVTSAPPGTAGPLRKGRDDLGPATAVPILQPELKWLTAWASLVSGQSAFAYQAVLGRRVDGPAVRRTAPPDGADTGPTPSRAARAAPAAAVPGSYTVRQFRAAASMGAYNLASALSVVPLSLPVMQAVLTLCFPTGSTVHLAEVITGGLMHRDPAQRSPAAAPAFQWLPGVREELRRTLTAGREREVLEAVSTYLDQSLGFRVGSREFQAVVASPDLWSDSSAVAYGKPFAQILPETARRLSRRFPESDIVLDGGGGGTTVEELLDRMNQLVRQARASGRSGQIEGAIHAARQAASAMPAGNERRGGAILALARMLTMRWRADGNLDDLDEAVVILRELLQSTGGPSPATTGCLVLLAEALRERFEATASPDYLDDAIDAHRAAIANLPQTGSDADEQRVLLAAALLRHHGITSTTLSLYEAVELLAGLEPLDRLAPGLRASADVSLARCLDVLSRSTRSAEDLGAADDQWLTVIGELGLVSSYDAVAVRTAFESRLRFLERTGRTAAARALEAAFDEALLRLPSGWGQAVWAEVEQESA